MSFFTYNGIADNGNTPMVNRASEVFVPMLTPIVLSNTGEIQMQNETNKILDGMYKKIPVGNGQLITVEKFNLRVSEGSYTSQSTSCNSKLTAFKWFKEDFKATVFNVTTDSLLEMDNETGSKEILVNENVRKLDKWRKWYINKYLPIQKTVAMITGSSASLTLPTYNAGGEYTDSVGALRGEDMTSELATSVVDRANRNHYRAKKASALSQQDVRTSARMIREYTDFSGGEVYGLANGSTLDDLVSVYGFEETKDKKYADIQMVRVIAGVKFVEAPLIPNGYICFVDGGEEELLVDLINKSTRQQGMGLFSKRTGMQGLYEVTDMEGLELLIWKHSINVFKREHILWLDIDNAEATGIMGATGLQGLADYAGSLRSDITGKAYTQ